MNSLSWLLYLIDVCSSFRVVSVAAAILLVASIGALWAVCAMRLEDSQKSEKDAVRATRSKWTWRFALLSAGLAIFSCLMPGKGTMYAIAASQIGEQVVKSEAIQGMASDAQKALQQWIKKQIEPENKS